MPGVLHANSIDHVTENRGPAYLLVFRWHIVEYRFAVQWLLTMQRRCDHPQSNFRSI